MTGDIKAALDCKRRFGALVCIGLLLLSAFLIYLPSELGEALTIPPDSSEYSISLVNLFEHGRFGFTLNGEWYPSRYAPWFSLLCLTPAYLLSGGNVLCLHWSILFFALVTLLIIWRVGFMAGLGKMSILPPILLLLMPDFVFYSRVVMTEIPYTAFIMLLAMVFVRFVNKVQISIRLCFGVGLLIACAGLVRSTGYILVIPFIAVALTKREKWARRFVLVSAVVVPIVVTQMAGMAYNWIVFDSPFRSGYHYWNAFPLDYPSVTFNWNYVMPAVSYFLTQPLTQMTLIFMGVSLLFALYVVLTGQKIKYHVFLILESFFLVHAAFVSAVYLGYYYADTRFFLPVSITSVLLFCIAVNELRIKIANSFLRKGMMVLLLALCTMIVLDAPCVYLNITRGRPVWIVKGQIAAQVIPPGSVVMQEGDPNIMDYFGFNDKGLTLYPFDREFDYCSHMVSPKSIASSYVPSGKRRELIVLELVESGLCRLPFPKTFKEDPEQIQKYISEGRRVFLHASFNEKDEAAKFMSRIESMGLTLRKFGVWKVPEVFPNPMRHLYDKILFPDCSMDSRPEITVAYYEVVPAGGAEGGSLQ